MVVSNDGGAESLKFFSEVGGAESLGWFSVRWMGLSH